MFLVRRFRISLLAVVALTLIAAADTFLGATAVCAEPGQLMLIGGGHQDLPNDQLLAETQSPELHVIASIHCAAWGRKSCC